MTPDDPRDIQYGPLVDDLIQLAHQRHVDDLIDSASGQNDPQITNEELLWLAKRLIAERLQNDPDWIEWEDVPMLNERAFMALQDALVATGKTLQEMVQEYEGSVGIDTADWLSRIRRGQATIDMAEGHPCT